MIVLFYIKLLVYYKKFIKNCVSINNNEKEIVLLF